MKRIAALVPNRLDVSPGQRTRIETWAVHLRERGWEIDFFPFESESLHEILYSSGRYVSKSVKILQCYAAQANAILRDLDHDGIFLYREAALIGPALLERMAKRRGLPMIFDIDDPIFLPYKSPVNKWMSLLKFSRKTHSLIRMSDRVITINGLIGDYARKFNENVTVVPNFVDAEKFAPRNSRPDGRPKIVWTGSVSTLRNLSSISDALKTIQAKHGTEILIVANGKTELDGIKLDFRDWSPQAEVSSLQESDIGIVPLLDIEWNPWKFFLKTIQYMAVGLPVVARRIGSNSEVIEHGVSGFLVESQDEWIERIEQLIEDKDLREKMGQAARKRVLDNFSIPSQVPRVLKIFEEVYGRSELEQ